MLGERLGEAVHVFTAYAMYALMGIVGLLVVLGLVNALVVMWRTLGSRKARHEHAPEDGPLPTGLLSAYTYLHLLADVLLVVVGIELIDTFLAFESREDPRLYLSGVIAAAIVALARRIIVFFNPEVDRPHTGEMYAYAALVAALAAAYAVINAFG